jgi:formylmethanofuran dehydrogenase subunit D
MDPAEEKKIVDEILENRALSYSIELLEVEGDKYTVRNNFGSTVIYKKKGSNYFLEDELD